jgi:hypothetical protein
MYLHFLSVRHKGISPMTFRTNQHRIWLLAATAALVSASLAEARYPDRWYRMGDDPAQGVAAGPVESVGGGFTFDSAGAPSQNQLHDLQSFNSPAYVNIAAARPVPAATSNNWAIQFDGADDYLLGANLGNPSQSIAHTSGGENYTNITDRGYQAWVKPLALPAAGAAVVLDDSEEFEFRVTSTGFWSTETRNDALTTSAAVTLNAWTHVAQVRPSGDSGGSRAWVNGIAVASQTGNYNQATTTGLVVGANAAPDGLGGTTVPPLAGSYFNGLVDEIDMFVLGGSYGAFDYTRDNGYFTDVFLPSKSAAYSYVDVTGPRGAADGHNDKVWVAGDVNFDGVRNQSDITAFVAGWRSTNAATVVGVGPRIGDYVTLGKGDLDLDGDTDINDFMRLRTSFAGVAVTLPMAEQLAAAVPEPGAAFITMTGVAALGILRRRQRS